MGKVQLKIKNFKNDYCEYWNTFHLANLMLHRIIVKVFFVIVTELLFWNFGNFFRFIFLVHFKAP